MKPFEQCLSKARRQHNEAIANGLKCMLQKAKLSAADWDAVLGRVRGTTNYEALSSCDFIIEAATENGALELHILRQIGDVAPDTERPPQRSKVRPGPSIAQNIALSRGDCMMDLYGKVQAR